MHQPPEPVSGSCAAHLALLLVQVPRKVLIGQHIKGGKWVCVRGRQSVAHACAALPFVCDKHHSPRTSRLITGVPRFRCRVVGEGGLEGQGDNKISHLHYNAISRVLPPILLFQGRLFKGCWSAGPLCCNSTVHRLHYLWASSLFYWFTKVGVGRIEQSSPLLEQHVPNDVTGLRGFVGVGQGVGWRGKPMVAMYVGAGRSGGALEVSGDEGGGGGAWHYNMTIHWSLTSQLRVWTIL